MTPEPMWMIRPPSGRWLSARWVMKNGAHVHREDLLELLGGDCIDDGGCTDAGVVDQDVEAVGVGVIGETSTNCGPSTADIQADLRVLRAAGTESIRSGGTLSDDVDAPGLATFYSTVVQGLSAQARDGTRAEGLNRVGDLAFATWPEP